MEAMVDLIDEAKRHRALTSVEVRVYRMAYDIVVETPAERARVTVRLGKEARA